MYPGTLSALGNGIYFAVPSFTDQQFLPHFPLASKIALKYTKGEDSGVLIRAALNVDAQVADCDILKEGLREFRNRVREAGITDIGTFAAAIGKDAYFADGIYDDTGEMVYTVLNRGMLWVQREARLIKNN
jgi:hypothetical protein